MGSKIWIDPSLLEKHFENHKLMIFMPCLGQPCFVQYGDNHFDMMILSKTNNHEEIHRKLDNTLRISELDDDKTFYEFDVADIDELFYYKDKNTGLFHSNNSDLLDAPGWHLFSMDALKPPMWFIQVRLTIKKPKSFPCKSASTLYNLDRLDNEGNIVERKYHAVCFTNRTWEEFKFMHITDLHIAKRNDDIPGIIEKSKPNDEKRNEFNGRYINFNDHLREFIKKVNESAESDKPDFILMTGDLIDYVIPSVVERPKVKRQTNWRYFHDILTGRSTTGRQPNTELQIPIFTLLGNHDYRFNHYRLSDGKKWKEFGLEANEFRQFDVHEFRVRSPGQLRANINAVNDYLFNFNPYFDYVVKLGNHRMICMDSGEDAFTSQLCLELIFEILKRAIRVGFGASMTYLLMRLSQVGQGLGGAIGGGPESSGLLTNQIVWADKVHKSQPNGLTLLAMHSPPVNKPPKVNIDNYRESQIAGNEKWIKMDDVDLSAASISRNWNEFLEFLSGANKFEKPVDLVLCGHTHCDLAFRLEKYPANTGKPIRYFYEEKVGIYTDEYAQELSDLSNHGKWWDSHRPIIMQTPSLGPKGNDKSDPGYRTIEVKNGTITNLDYIELK